MIFSCIVWAAMLVAALWYSALYGFNVPYYDEWGFVDQLTGENITLEWLWSAYGDHRLPLAKLIWLFWIKTTNSFRVGTYVNIVVLGFLAMAMIWAARRLRGKASYTDAFFPLVMLHLGQGVNFLWSYQISEMLPAFLECAILLIALSRPRLEPRGAVWIGICLILLALSGPGGLPFALAVSVGLAAWGLGQWQIEDRRGAVRAIGLTATAIVLGGLYFLGFKGQDQQKTAENVTRGAVEFLSVSLGTATEPAWRFAGVGVVALLLIGMLLALLAWFRRPAERFRASMVFLILGAGLALAMGMGLARGPYGPGGGLSHWYVIFAFPALCAVYFAWVLYGPTTLSGLVQMCLFTVACGLLPLNVSAGRAKALERLNIVRAFERDLETDMPPIELAARYGYPISDASEYATIPGNFEHSLQKLHGARVGPFGSMQGPFIDWERKQTLSLAPVRTNDLVWEGDTANCTGPDPYIIFALDKPVFVSVVRLTFKYEGSSTDAHCEFYWCDTRHNGFIESERYRQWTQPTTPRKPGEDPNYYKDVVVNDWVDRIRIDPDNKPCTFQLKQVELFSPSQ